MLKKNFKFQIIFVTAGEDEARIEDNEDKKGLTNRCLYYLTGKDEDYSATLTYILITFDAEMDIKHLNNDNW